MLSIGDIKMNKVKMLYRIAKTTAMGQVLGQKGNKSIGKYKVSIQFCLDGWGKSSKYNL